MINKGDAVQDENGMVKVVKDPSPVKELNDEFDDADSE